MTNLRKIITDLGYTSADLAELKKEYHDKSTPSLN